MLTLAFTDVYDWMLKMVQSYGYLGIFLVSIFGNLTLFFPLPYLLVIFAFSTVLDPLIVTIVAATGALIGEFFAYGIGRGGHKIVVKYSETCASNVESFKRMPRKVVFLAVILFAFTPLPDDSILIPLGVAGYDWKTIGIACFLGKLFMCGVVAFSARYGLKTVIDMISPDKSINPVSIIIGIAIMVVATIIILKINWLKLVERFSSKW